MGTFQDLIKEVQERGLCHYCGACVNFCTALNFGALELDASGKPRLVDQEKCVECGLCYAICPETEELNQEVKEKYNCTPPFGQVKEVFMARSLDSEVLSRASDGGVITTLLLYLFDHDYIDGALVSRQIGPFNRVPWLALTRQEIFESAGFCMKMSQGMQILCNIYSTFASPVEKFKPLMQKGLRRVALVAPPCQIKAIRKMQYQNLVPSESIRYCFGIFCIGSFTIGPQERQQLEKLGGFQWDSIKKINLKEDLVIHLQDGQIKYIPLKNLDFIKRQACNLCPDYTAECADISFGSLGSDWGWTTVMTRTPLGQRTFKEVPSSLLEMVNEEQQPDWISQIITKVTAQANKKRLTAQQKRAHLLIKSTD